MHLKTFPALITLSLLTGSLLAADTPAASSTNAVVMPSTVVPAAAPAAAPNQIVYTPRLPTAAELTSAAAAQNLSVERLEQSPTQIVAYYKNAAGQTNVVAYQALPPAGTSNPAPAYTTTTPAPSVVMTTPPPTVVYEQPGPRSVYYYDDDPIYYPRIWYPPVSLSLGFGFGHFHGRGGFGGFHRWR